MTVVRPDWTSAQPPTPEKTGPETYAPPAQRMPEPPISDRDPDSIPLQQSEGVGQANTSVTQQLDSLIRRVAAASIDDIDGAIRELESVREMLRDKGQRLSHEVVDYVNLSLTSMRVTRFIAESLRHVKDARC